jgi:uncharacterized membrane protein YobD (UPF0266 family)
MFIGTSQPTYLPWAGYFGMMSLSDTFIILDDVQFERRSWQQRNFIKGVNGKTYLSLSVKKKGLRDQKINEVVLNNPIDDFYDHMKSMENYYNKSKYFREYKNIFFEIYERKYIKLFDINYAFINLIKKILRIDAKLILSSTLKKKGKKNDLIFSLLDNFSIKNYLVNPGSLDYLKNEKREYNLYLFDYNSSDTYKQLYNNYIPYLSIIDMIFNIGDKETIKYIKKCSHVKKIN